MFLLKREQVIELNWQYESIGFIKRDLTIEICILLVTYCIQLEITLDTENQALKYSAFKALLVRNILYVKLQIKLRYIFVINQS